MAGYVQVSKERCKIREKNIPQFSEKLYSGLAGGEAFPGQLAFDGQLEVVAEEGDFHPPRGFAAHSLHVGGEQPAPCVSVQPKGEAAEVAQPFPHRDREIEEAGAGGID